MSDNQFWRVPPSDHFAQVVRAYEAIFPDYIYKDSINKIKQKNLNCLNEKDIDIILNPFFLKWGSMSRHLGFAGCKKVGELLKEMSEELFDIRYYNLHDDFEKVKNLPELYNKIRYAEFKSTWNGTKKVCSTATSKALHLIAPDFFVMWDDPIRDFYGYTKAGTGKDYQKFLANMKYWIEGLNPTITSLSEQFGKTNAKIIDEFNWYRLRPWWHT